jgi:hypothetical protein
VRVFILSSSFSTPPPILDYGKSIAAFDLFAYAITVVGHSMFQDMWVNGYGSPLSSARLLLESSRSSLLNGGSRSVDESNTCTRAPPSNSPVTTVTSDDIRCNVGGSKGVAGVCAALGMLYLFPSPNFLGLIKSCLLAET